MGERLTTDQYIQDKKMILANASNGNVLPIEEMFSRYGVEINVEINEFSAKALFLLYRSLYFEDPDCESEQYTRLNAASDELTNALKQKNSRSATVLMGSFSLGKCSRSSDLDVILIQNGDPDKDIEALRSLEVNNSWQFTRDISPIENLHQVAEEGLHSRMYALTNEGIEIEFFVIDAKNAKRMSQINPGKVTRVEPTTPKMESRVTILGEKVLVPKDDITVPSYLWHEGKLVRGFIVDGLLTGDVKHDPEGLADQTIKELWYSVLKSYAYHSGHIKKDDSQRYRIDAENINFTDFLATMYHNDPNKYSNNRIEDMKRMFNQAKIRLMQNFNVD